MMVVRHLEGLARDPAGVVTVGTFDGIHLGHREIIREVVHRARMREGRSVVVTFDPHPKEVVGRGEVRLLTTIDERIALLRELQVDLLCIIPFTWEFSRQSSRDFYRTVVVEGLGVSEVVVGYDHMFGRDREAGIGDLIRMGQEFAFSVFAVHPHTMNGVTVSSSKIRGLLLEGDVTAAAELLGAPYRLSGVVVHGDGRGAALRYPTANIRPSSPVKLVPGRGVYLVAVRHGGVDYAGMMNIGVRPTVSAGARLMLEVHILDFQRTIYGEPLTVTFLRRLREERRFGSTEELVRQLDLDREHARRLLTQGIGKPSSGAQTT
jgi:riboflavin kinase/FMN adenylyltransferase